jgi:hypothetical protein
MASARGLEQRPPRIQIGTRAAAAAWTWATVRSGFFPPVPLAKLGQEQVADGAQDEVPPDRPPLADLEVVHPELAFGVLEHPLDPPPAQGHGQDRLGRRLRDVRGKVGTQYHFPLAIPPPRGRARPWLASPASSPGGRRPMAARIPGGTSTARMRGRSSRRG